MVSSALRTSDSTPTRRCIREVWCSDDIVCEFVVRMLTCTLFRDGLPDDNTLATHTIPVLTVNEDAFGRFNRGLDGDGRCDSERVHGGWQTVSV